MKEYTAKELFKIVENGNKLSAILGEENYIVFEKDSERAKIASYRKFVKYLKDTYIDELHEPIHKLVFKQDENDLYLFTAILPEIPDGYGGIFESAKCEISIFKKINRN